MNPPKNIPAFSMSLASYLGRFNLRQQKDCCRPRIMKQPNEGYNGRQERSRWELKEGPYGADNLKPQQANDITPVLLSCCCAFVAPVLMGIPEKRNDLRLRRKVEKKIRTNGPLLFSLFCFFSLFFFLRPRVAFELSRWLISKFPVKEASNFPKSFDYGFTF